MTTISWPASAGVHTEVGRLQTVMLHRPGREIRRLTPRNSAVLLFDGLPWMERAQEEHDAFAQVLTDRNVQVVYLRDLLEETIEQPEARTRIIDEMLEGLELGSQLISYLGKHLHNLSSHDLAEALMAGLRNDELNGMRSLVTSILAPEDFLLPPLPNLYFTRDSSAWVGANPMVTSLFWPARGRENHLTQLVYDLHPAFEEHRPHYGWSPGEHTEGGDIMCMAPGVLAVGCGERTTPAGVERMAHHFLGRGDIHTILAVPLDKSHATMHLDTVCTMVDTATFTVYPNMANSMMAFRITATDTPGKLHVDHPVHFFDAAAQVLGVDKVKVIDSKLDVVEAEREQWDDGFNCLAIAPGTVIAYERNHGSNSRMEAEGIEVLRIKGDELGTGRGGPRCMSCPISRETVN